MSKMKLALVVLAISFGLGACGKGDSSATGTSGSSAGGKMIDFVTTQDGKPLVIDPALFDTPAAKEFMTTGKNPYIGNAEAIAKGKKVFQLYSCTQCHGPEAKGQVGPGLVGPDYKYPKDITNKGMFETVWHGTNGGMGAKGVGLMDPNDPKNGITPDELLKIIAWVRSMSNVTGNE
ncbi:MAG TPA: c-type cytochrome [Methylotenera sp.]|nr:c-type cytochrome [Methylotenera sp.]